MSEWREQFRQQVAEPALSVAELDEQMIALENEAADWTEVAPRIADTVIPAEKAWIKTIKQLRMPFNLRPIYFRKWRLQAYRVATWSRPSALRVRLGNMKLRGLILLQLIWKHRKLLFALLVLVLLLLFMRWVVLNWDAIIAWVVSLFDLITSGVGNV